MAAVRCCRCWRERIPPTWLVICGVLVVQFGFGLYPTLVKKLAAQESADPYIFSFYRDSCCTPLLFICALVAERKILIPDLKILVVLILLGFVGMFCNQLLFITGVYRAGPDVASALQPIIPVWTTILAVLTCTEKIPSPYMLHTWAKLLGMLLSAGGAIELSLTGNLASCHGNSSECQVSTATSTTHDALFGYLAIFANTFCWGIYILMQKRCVFNKPQCRWKDYPVNVTAYSYFFGSIFMGMLSVYFAATKQYSKFHLPDDSIYLLIYAIFIASATCYLLMTWANVHIPATLVTAFWPANVLVTVVSSLFLTGDELAPLQYFGTVLLLIGLFLVLFANHMDERLLAHKPVIMLDCWCPVQKRQRKLVVISETKSQDLPSETASNHKSLFSNDTKSEADDEELVSTSCYKDASGRKNYGAIN